MYTYTGTLLDLHVHIHRNMCVLPGTVLIASSLVEELCMRCHGDMGLTLFVDFLHGQPMKQKWLKITAKRHNKADDAIQSRR